MKNEEHFEKNNMDKINQNEGIFGFNNYSSSEDDKDDFSNILSSFINEVL